MELSILTPGDWNDYQLIDSGDRYKLERFGAWTISRPEPQALWRPSLSPDEWRARADARFVKSKGTDERGEWILSPNMPDRWVIDYRGLKMRLGLTSFKHVGIFPEQAANWDFIEQSIAEIDQPRPAVLNLFAYTGGATLAAAKAGAEVTHVDSVKQVVSWSRENMELSGLDGVRWVVDDALKFAAREVRRGRKYYGIILDPPSYGRGPDGEKWILEENIQELLSLCSQLLHDHNSFLVLNLYSMGLSAMLARTLTRQLFNGQIQEQMGELYLEDNFGKQLPLGVFYRMFRK